MNTSNN